jgi:hypothetical protein
MAKKIRLAHSRKAEAHKIDMAIKMAQRGESSPHGRRKNPKAIRHGEVDVPYIPLMAGFPQPKPASKKHRRGRHHAPRGW